MLKDAIKLLEQYQEFKKKRPDGSLSEFGSQLSMSDQPDREQSDIEYAGSKMPFKLPVKSIDEYIGWIWGRLVGFTEVWEKKAFAGQLLHNSTEFGIAMYVMSHENCSKTAVAQQTLQEKTTIFETIKRMIQNGLIEEIPNPNDKRSKQIRLSEKGRMAAFQLMQKMAELSRHLTGNLNSTEKKALFDVLHRLDQYHQFCYEQYKDEQWEKLKEDLLD